MEQTKELQGSGKRGTNSAQEHGKPGVRRVVIRESQPLLSGSDVSELAIKGKVSSAPQSWRSLGLGEMFSRSHDGSFIHVKVSCSKAYALDSANPVTLTPDQQMSTRIYRVWLNSF